MLVATHVSHLMETPRGASGCCCCCCGGGCYCCFLSAALDDETLLMRHSLDKVAIPSFKSSFNMVEHHIGSELVSVERLLSCLDNLNNSENYEYKIITNKIRLL